MQTVALKCLAAVMKEQTLAIPRSSRLRPVSETFQAAAWRAPSSPRFDNRPANDVAHHVEVPESADSDQAAGSGAVPSWFIAIAGGLILAMLVVFGTHATSI